MDEFGQDKKRLRNGVADFPTLDGLGRHMKCGRHFRLGQTQVRTHSLEQVYALATDLFLRPTFFQVVRAPSFATSVVRNFILPDL